MWVNICWFLGVEYGLWIKSKDVMMDRVMVLRIYSEHGSTFTLDLLEPFCL
ncbi:hypothetical protein HanIR_Chr11g0509761 [Helianthus annuus]|nr:hypothetical protein HanIR_Chr11g0509761 [Helianthus annuus]